MEDNPADQKLISEALAKGRNKFHIVSDGQAAISFLRKEGEYANSPRPQLVLLDLHLPKKDGGQVLREIKGDPTLHLVPVVMFTTSIADQDVRNAYSLHVNAYIVKPSDLDQFLAVVRAIGRSKAFGVQQPSYRTRFSV